MRFELETWPGDAMRRDLFLGAWLDDATRCDTLGFILWVGRCDAMRFESGTPPGDAIRCDAKSIR